MIPAYSSEEIRDIYGEASGTAHSDIFFLAQKVQEQPMWYGYDRLLSLFKEDAEKYLMGEITLQEAMGDFEEGRKEILRSSSAG